jgi:hypothetical protein
MTMATSLNIILSWFETGDFPTQAQFQASWSSFWHKDEAISMDKILNLNTTLSDKVDISVYNAHLTNEEAHTGQLAKKDGSNLSNENIEQWKDLLEVGVLPSNIATVDDGVNVGNVYTKIYTDNTYMQLSQYTNTEGKILADMVEALGLTRLKKFTENTIQEFAANAADYEFEESDIIALPSTDPEPLYSLFFYTEGDKTDVNNYLPTQFSNITMSMVEGLIDALEQKIGKPSSDGKFYIKRVSGITTTEPLADETLATVMNRDNLAPRPLKFHNDAQIWFDSVGYNYFFNNKTTTGTGSGNTGFGYGSLTALISGVSNSGFGLYSGNKLTTGKFGTFIGESAGFNSTTGDGNTYLGQVSGFSAITPFKNTFTGTAAGYSNLNGKLNCIYGYKAANTVDLGDRNIIIGAFSAQGVTPTNCIILGVGAGFNDGALQNKLIIHNNHTLTGYSNTSEGNFGSYQQGTLEMALITGDFVARWVHFNGTFSINPVYIPIGDSAYNKIFVGNASGQFGWIDKVDPIPLAGTQAGKPVTGDIEFDINNVVSIKSGNAKITVNAGINTISSGTSVSDPERSFLNVAPTQVYLGQSIGDNGKFINISKELTYIVVGTNVDGAGLVGANYYGDHYIDNSFVQKKFVEEKTAKPYKFYRALLQFAAGTFEPEFIVLENSLGNISWSRNAAGEYLGDLANSFTQNKTWAISEINSNDGGVPFGSRTGRLNDNTLYLSIFRENDGSPVNLAGQCGIIDIYVYN